MGKNHVSNNRKQAGMEVLERDKKCSTAEKREQIMSKKGALMSVFIRHCVYELFEEVECRKITAKQANEKIDDFLREEEALLEDDG